MKYRPKEITARIEADKTIQARFAPSLGITTFEGYLDHVDLISTCQLSPALAAHVIATTGEQRRNARLSLDEKYGAIIQLPLPDPRRPGAFFWVELEFFRWVDLIEMGAFGAWFFAYKGKDRPDGQVRTKVPLSGGTTVSNATIARLIAGAKANQQARVLDKNPLNLKRDNVALFGLSSPTGGHKARTKTDTQAQVQERKALLIQLAGRDYSFKEAGDE